MMRKLAIFLVGFMLLILVLRWDKHGTSSSPIAPIPVHTEYVEKIVHDTIVVTQQVVQYVERSDYTKTIPDKSLLRDADIPVRRVQLQTDIAKSLKDSVKPNFCDSVISYHDHWADIRFYPKDSTFQYNIRDSLQIYVSYHRKHKFLFFKWGRKIYDVTTVHYNPNSFISFSTSVAVK